MVLNNWHQNGNLEIRVDMLKIQRGIEIVGQLILKIHCLGRIKRIGGLELKISLSLFKSSHYVLLKVSNAKLQQLSHMTQCNVNRVVNFAELILHKPHLERLESYNNWRAFVKTGSF